MGVLPHILEIVFKEQMKMSIEKITREKKSFSTYKMHFLFLLFGPFLLSKLLTFSLLFLF
jgi:hypothetical protein